MKQNKRTFNAGVKLWIAAASGAGVFGEGRYRLLTLIDKHGSLKKAAETMNMSYRKAWGDIRKSEERTGRRLITRTCGGRHGGGSQLTPFAEKLLQAYRSLKDRTRETAQKEYEKLFCGLL